MAGGGIYWKSETKADAITDAAAKTPYFLTDHVPSHQQYS